MMAYRVPYCSLTDPKAREFFAQFPFVGEKYGNRILVSSAKLIEPKVQRMDLDFLCKSVEYSGFLGLPFLGFSWGIILLLDEQGNTICEVGKSKRWRQTETVYAALKRIAEADVSLIRYGLYVLNRGRIPLIVVYQLPKRCSLQDLIIQFEEGAKREIVKEVAA